MVADFSWSGNADVRAVSYWANHDYDAYRHFKTTRDFVAMPIDPDFGEEVAQTASAARLRYGPELIEFERQLATFRAGRAA